MNVISIYKRHIFCQYIIYLKNDFNFLEIQKHKFRKK